MQRWIKLPDGRFIDANRIACVGKVESYPRLDEDGNDLGAGFVVSIGTDFPRERQFSVTGTHEEIMALTKALLGPSAG
ncbi:MAG TPA: hypothetical protein VND63_06360 [Rhodanobacteraceae bacterium]|nr:hypothetical protein [Rhodanobacteraceae bacterium]